VILSRERLRASVGSGTVVAGKLLFSALTIAAYGFHRDELYLQQCARHLEWGFVDHGPLVPAMSFLALHGFGDSPAAARVFSSAASAATVWAAARVASALGGGRLAQFLTALLVASAPLFVYSGGVYGTNAFDQLSWTLAGLCTVRIAAGERRWYPWLGVCVGLGILAKPTMILGATCLIAALLSSQPAARTRQPGPWITLAIAALLASPLALWEQAHAWPGIGFVAARRDDGVLCQGGPLAVLADQLRLLGPFSCAAAFAGVVTALRRGADIRVRTAALPYLFALVAIAASGGKPYYASSAAPLAIATGAVAVAGSVAAFARLSFVALAVAAVIQCVGALPLLPRFPLAMRLHPDLVQFAEWPALVAEVGRMHAANGFPPDAPVLTDSYGTAAALVRFGGPRPLSGSNAFGSWAWGPGFDEPNAVLAIGYPPALLRRFFERVEPAGVIEIPGGGDNEYDFPRQAWFCVGRRTSLRREWGAFAHYD
jgi:4-amino-4-deoxy-L-arabinose transferase-like glycosyltransferase